MNAFRHSLTRAFVASSVAVLPGVMLSAEAAFAGKADFRVYNDSNLAVVQLYVSESDLSSWGSDILGSDILASGYNTQVLFGNPSPNACLYDIRAVFEDGQVVEDYQINVCHNDYYTFYDQ